MPNPRGFYAHKLGCTCTPCVRSKKAIPPGAGAGDVGTGGTSLEPTTPKLKPNEYYVKRHKVRGKPAVLNADLPPIIVKGRSARDRVLEWLELRTIDPTLTNKAIAAKMGISSGHLYSLLSLAAKEGWLQFDDPVQRIDNQIVPKVLDNLNEFLDQKDKAVTLRTAEGTVFKTYQEAKGVSDVAQSVLALNIQLAEPSNMKTIEGHIVGRPKVLEGERSEQTRP